jgi:hypothetical protein
MKLEKIYEYLEMRFGGFVLAVPLNDEELRIDTRGVDADFKLDVSRVLRREVKREDPDNPLPDYGQCAAEGCNAPAVGRAACRTCKGVIAYCDEHGGRKVAHRDALRCESAHRYAAATPEQREFTDRIKAGWGFWTDEIEATIARQHEAGKTYAAIASEIGRSVCAVKHHIGLYYRRLEHAERSTTAKEEKRP